ncbi:uncharacterized protein LACBIDRAFT_321940 [Laccaria bicolor S238N-H82]|uniref:Predicted protein n=1 Tax=Laccaria bicolor (strain S238N-H82 / ATCC MYA-4686) TaxID=486041 RepID=B0CUQ3_LACBS|nr:uncharacterized protein LACBIDRAFT_321940 [Laccaria bicolor S238N-H82]EDR14132.1 predicted protein [Laccaria bicolor S238N-H82]|eukprot:XP_001874691.1 predicted protein [Laccaria bicolor S238N-H82]
MHLITVIDYKQDIDKVALLYLFSLTQDYDNGHDAQWSGVQHAEMCPGLRRRAVLFSAERKKLVCAVSYKPLSETGWKDYTSHDVGKLELQNLRIQDLTWMEESKSQWGIPSAVLRTCGSWRCKCSLAGKAVNRTLTKSGRGLAGPGGSNPIHLSRTGEERQNGWLAMTTMKKRANFGTDNPLLQPSSLSVTVVRVLCVVNEGKWRRGKKPAAEETCLC